MKQLVFIEIHKSPLRLINYLKDQNEVYKPTQIITTNQKLNNLYIGE